VSCFLFVLLCLSVMFPSYETARVTDDDDEQKQGQRRTCMLHGCDWAMLPYKQLNRIFDGLSYVVKGSYAAKLSLSICLRQCSHVTA